MQFRVFQAHIWYGNSNTVYSGGVRAVTAHPLPCCRLLPILRTDTGTGVYTYYSIKKLWGYTISCVCYGMHRLQIYEVLIFQRLYSYNYSDNLHNGKCCHIYIQNIHCKLVWFIWFTFRYCNLYDVVNLLAKSGLQLSAACLFCLSVCLPVYSDTVYKLFCYLLYWYVVLAIQ